MSNQSIYVTGGASGIGKAVVLGSAKRGDRVAVLDVNIDAAKAVAQEALDLGAVDAVAVQCDVSAEIGVSDAFEAAALRIGPPTGVHANAGIEINHAVHELQLSEWQRVLNVNLTGVFLTCRTAVRQMLSGGTVGSIVCTSSPSAFVAFAGGANGAYAASKGGVSAFVRAMALDYAAAGIRVNAVIPGATDTPMLRPSDPDAHLLCSTDLLAQAAAQIPLGRLADPREIANAVLWLLSDASSYVTGSQLVCDGGLMAKSANTI